MANWDEEGRQRGRLSDKQKKMSDSDLRIEKLKQIRDKRKALEKEHNVDVMRELAETGDHESVLFCEEHGLYAFEEKDFTQATQDFRAAATGWYKLGARTENKKYYLRAGKNFEATLYAEQKWSWAPDMEGTIEKNALASYALAEVSDEEFSEVIERINQSKKNTPNRWGRFMLIVLAIIALIVCGGLYACQKKKSSKTSSEAVQVKTEQPVQAQPPVASAPEQQASPAQEDWLHVNTRQNAYGVSNEAFVSPGSRNGNTVTVKEKINGGVKDGWHVVYAMEADCNDNTIHFVTDIKWFDPSGNYKYSLKPSNPNWYKATGQKDPAVWNYICKG